jgi:hypothetical protein
MCFLALLALLLLAPQLAAAAQQAANVPRVGILGLRGQEPVIEAFRVGLRQLR